MRPYGTSEQLQARRERALKLLKRGQSAQDVAEQMKVTVRSVYRWQQAHKQPKPKRE